eukprot:1015180-Amphidinium_carterae.1
MARREGAGLRLCTLAMPASHDVVQRLDVEWNPRRSSSDIDQQRRLKLGGNRFGARLSPVDRVWLIPRSYCDTRSRERSECALRAASCLATFG